MKYLVLIFSIVSISCMSQETIDFKGNWYVGYNSSVDSLDYTEIYFDDNIFTKYNEDGGVTPSYKYEFSKGFIYLVSIDGKEKVNSGEIIILDNNTFSIKQDSERVVFKRITYGLMLDEYLLTGESVRNEYWKAFNKRKYEFEKLRTN